MKTNNNEKKPKEDFNLMDWCDARFKLQVKWWIDVLIDVIMTGIFSAFSIMFTKVIFLYQFSAGQFDFGLIVLTGSFSLMLLSIIDLPRDHARLKIAQKLDKAIKDGIFTKENAINIDRRWDLMPIAQHQQLVEIADLLYKLVHPKGCSCEECNPPTETTETAKETSERLQKK